MNKKYMRYIIFNYKKYLQLKNGFETSKEIISLIKNENFVPSYIVSYSCNAGIEFESTCKSIGYKGFMIKPID